MQLYDAFIAFSDGYREGLFVASEELPEEGLIGDVASGTGNGSGYLVSFKPQRKTIGFDKLPKAVEIAKEKLTKLSEALGLSMRSSFVVADALEYAWERESLDGAFLNNGLYPIAAQEADAKKRFDLRLSVLKKIHDGLKQGKLLVLNDPLPESSAIFHQFTLKSVESALKNGAFMTEQELALIIAFNRKAILANNTFLSEAERKQMADEAGFEVVKTLKGGYDTGLIQVLRKR
jgi:SAM-dependent methyltransferase